MAHRSSVCLLLQNHSRRPPCDAQELAINHTVNLIPQITNIIIQMGLTHILLTLHSSLEKSVWLHLITQSWKPILGQSHSQHEAPEGSELHCWGFPAYPTGMLYLNGFSLVVKFLDIFFLTHSFKCTRHSQAEPLLLVSEKITHGFREICSGQGQRGALQGSSVPTCS